MNEKKVLREGHILTGSLFSESMRVESVRANGPDTWLVGLVGTQTERFRRVTLTARDLESRAILQVLSLGHCADFMTKQAQLLA